MSKPFINGSVEWLVAMREGAFSNLKPIPWEPKPRPKMKSEALPSAYANDPLVVAVLARFPGSEIVEVRDAAPVVRGTTPWVKPAPRSRIKRTPRLSDGRLMTSGFLRAVGTPCHYCARPMSLEDPGLLPTRDHVHPQSKGGKATVWACDDCNHLKGDKLLDEWTAFIAATPEWWRLRKGRRRPLTLASGNAVPNSQQLAIIPRHESMMIMRHGKDFWRAWKDGAKSCDCCRPEDRGAVRYTAEGWPIVPNCRKD